MSLGKFNNVVSPMASYVQRLSTGLGCSSTVGLPQGFIELSTGKPVAEGHIAFGLQEFGLERRQMCIY